MKRTLLTAFAAVLLSAAIGQTARATEVGYSRKFGLGVVIGDPTGLSAKLWIAPTNSLDFGLGFWSGVNGDCFSGQPGGTPSAATSATTTGRSTWTTSGSRTSSAGRPSSTGTSSAAARIIWWGGCQDNCIAVAARAPIGLDLMFTNPSFLEVFFELAPDLLDCPRHQLRHRRRRRRPVLPLTHQEPWRCVFSGDLLTPIFKETFWEGSCDLPRLKKNKKKKIFYESSGV